MSKIDPKQIISIRSFDDDYLSSLDFGSNLEELPATLEDNLNAIATQVKRIIGKTNWYDDPDTSLATRTILRQTTGDATATELTTDGAAASGTTNRFIVSTDTTTSFTMDIVGREGGDGDHCLFTRRGLIENTSGTTTMVLAAEAIGTDSNLGGWGVPSIAADNTNNALTVTVTGLAATDIEWLCVINAVELTHT